MQKTSDERIMRRVLFAALALCFGCTSEIYAQALTGSAASLTFTWQQGAKLPASQTLSVRDGAAQISELNGISRRAAFARVYLRGLRTDRAAPSSRASKGWPGALAARADVSH